MRNPLKRLLRRDVTADNIEHRCGSGFIVLPAGHKLPEYQRAHPHYDRFLPHLARHVPAGATIVDVGANVGDTLAAMAAAASGAHFLCVEPEPTFYHYLETNAERVRAAMPGVHITLRQALVGRAVQQATLECTGGTAHARQGRPGESALASQTLDALVAAAGLPSVALLKSDVDGFDFDVIASAEALIARDEPLLFFECQPLNATQHTGFHALLARLKAVGYQHWVAFDNFGQTMLRSGDAGAVAQLLDYAWRQGQQPGTRSIYYIDVLTATARNASVLDAALATY